MKTDGQLVTLEQLVRYSSHLPPNTYLLPLLTGGFVQVSTIEFSLVEVSVLHGLKQGNDVLKEIHKELNIESVEKLLEETAEAREYQRVCLFSFHALIVFFLVLSGLGLYRRKSIICLSTTFP